MRTSWMLLIVVVIALVACQPQVYFYTPTRSPAAATPTPTPTLTPTPTPTPTSTPTPTPSPTPTLTPTPAQPLLPPPTAAPGEIRVRVTEEQVNAQLAQGVPGITYTNASIAFREDGRVEFHADTVQYGVIAITDLTVVGRVDVADCKATFVMEEVQPRTLVTALIPGLVNQALSQYLAGYCVLDVTIRAGELEVTLRKAQ